MKGGEVMGFLPTPEFGAMGVIPTLEQMSNIFIVIHTNQLFQGGSRLNPNITSNILHHYLHSQGANLNISSW